MPDLKPETEDEPGAAAFARSALGHPMGKLLDELKTKVDPETGLAFRRIAHDMGTDTAGLLRDFVYNVSHGKTFTDMQIDAAKVKREQLFGTGSLGALMGDAK